MVLDDSGVVLGGSRVVLKGSRWLWGGSTLGLLFDYLISLHIGSGVVLSGSWERKVLLQPSAAWWRCACMCSINESFDESLMCEGVETSVDWRAELQVSDTVSECSDSSRPLGAQLEINQPNILQLPEQNVSYYRINKPKTQRKTERQEEFRRIPECVVCFGGDRVHWLLHMFHFLSDRKHLQSNNATSPFCAMTSMTAIYEVQMWKTSEWMSGGGVEEKNGRHHTKHLVLFNSPEIEHGSEFSCRVAAGGVWYTRLEQTRREKVWKEERNSPKDRKWERWGKKMGKKRETLKGKKLKQRRDGERGEKKRREREMTTFCSFLHWLILETHSSHTDMKSNHVIKTKRLIWTLMNRSLRRLTLFGSHWAAQRPAEEFGPSSCKHFQMGATPCCSVCLHRPPPC